MRRVLIDELGQCAMVDERIALLIAECGYSVTEGFEKKYPSRFYNVGIAEQSLISVAAGMALSGMKPVVYSMVPFLTMRAYEQIRVDVCYQNIPVILVGVGSGMSYGATGVTHHSIEDIAIMRVLPNMNIICPSSFDETRQAIRSALTLGKPCYISLGKGETFKEEQKTEFEFGKATLVKNGSDAVIFTYGGMVATACEVWEYLSKQGIIAAIYNMSTIKPLDTNILKKVVNKCKLVYCLEEHNVIGGLGSAIAEYIAENGYTCIYRRIGINDKYPEYAGGHEWLKKYNGIDAESITDIVISDFKNLSHMTVN